MPISSSVIAENETAQAKYDAAAFDALFLKIPEKLAGPSKHPLGLFLIATIYLLGRLCQAGPTQSTVTFTAAINQNHCKITGHHCNCLLMFFKI